LLIPPLVFISRGGEDHLTPAMAQGKVGDGSCWQGMVSVSFSSIMLAGYGCVGMGHAGFLGKWGGEREGKNSGKIFKNILLLPCLCICRGEAEPCRSKRHRVVFFLKKRKTKFGSDPKLGYDSCPPLYNAYRAKTLRSKLVKKTKGKKMI